jgi:hypothetical protein|tara:strand:- start:5 stop:346 length:342 start_codon:yes stop_codon:yes gene_type:complete
MKKLKTTILVIFIISLALEFLSDKYELFSYPENITTILAFAVLASILVNIFSNQELKKKFVKKEFVIILAIIPLYIILEYFTDFHLFLNFLIVCIILFIGLFSFSLLKNKSDK